MHKDDEIISKKAYNSKINFKLVQNVKGITLITLVITIIVILILSTVTINTVVGDDGIIAQAQLTQETAQNSLQGETGRMNTILQEYTNIMDFDSSIAGPSDPGGSGGNTGGSTNTENPGGGTDEPDEPASGDSIESVLKEGDWVYYVDNSNTYRKCRVLYGPENENYESYGVQIITMTTAEIIGLVPNVSTTSNTDAAMINAISQYNTAIDTLTTAANNYTNEKYATNVRSVGSVPNVPNYDAAGMRTNSYVGMYNQQFKDIDNNYLTDYNQMVALGINNIDTVYWLASRNASEGRYNTSAYYVSYNLMRLVDASGNLADATLFRIMSVNNTSYPHQAYAYGYGLRLVIRLKPEVKVVGGQGTETDPYQLGV